MPEEQEEGRMQLAGVDIRRVGARDRLVLGLALGSAINSFRHSSDEQECEDWLARAAMDVCVALDVLTSAREHLASIAVNGGSAEPVVYAMLALSGIGVASLGRAIRDVDYLAGERAEDDDPNGARVTLELDREELKSFYVLCGALGITSESTAAIEAWIKHSPLAVRESLAKTILQACKDATKPGPTESELEDLIASAHAEGGEANLVPTARGLCLIDLLEILGLQEDIQVGSALHKWMAKVSPDVRMEIARDLRDAVAYSWRTPDFDLDDAAMCDTQGDLKEFLKNYPNANPSRLALAITNMEPKDREMALMLWGAEEESIDPGETQSWSSIAEGFTRLAKKTDAREAELGKIGPGEVS